MATKKKTAKKAVKKTVKRVVRKTASVEKQKEGKLVGRITHYFSNIQVAVVELSSPLKEGDSIRIMGGQETDFDQEVSSMQINHEEVRSAKKGDDVGMKVKEKVHEGYKVYKI